MNKELTKYIANICFSISLIMISVLCVTLAYIFYQEENLFAVGLMMFGWYFCVRKAYIKFA